MDQTLLQVGLFLAGALLSFGGSFVAMKTSLALLLHRVNELEEWRKNFTNWRHNVYTVDHNRLQMQINELQKHNYSDEIAMLRKELYDHRNRQP